MVSARLDRPIVELGGNGGAAVHRLEKLEVGGAVEPKHWLLKKDLRKLSAQLAMHHWLLFFCETKDAKYLIALRDVEAREHREVDATAETRDPDGVADGADVLVYVLPLLCSRSFDQFSLELFGKPPLMRRLGL